MASVRTRFAPSPTGYLHIGGARTALYNWLYARKHGGVFILRVEDTDKARSTDENTKAILDGMRWLGLDWDEGPVLQSDRSAIYLEHVERLLASGKAYRCYCTKEELDAKRETAQAAKITYGYDRTCRYPARNGVSGPRTGPFVVRAAFEEDGQTIVHDLVNGDVVFENKELSDEIILRSDGGPMYNLCVVVDDAEMKITHVLRGNDHLNNTPKQIQLYKAFGFEPPLFGHMPLIFGADKKKLSKRNNVVAVSDYEEKGYLPEGMANFLARLGWAHGDEEIFSLKRLVEAFDIEGIGTSNGIYDGKKLDFLNGHWIKTLPPEEIQKRLVPYLTRRGWKAPPPDVLEAMVACTRERSPTLVAMAAQFDWYFTDELAYDPKAVEKNLKGRSELLDSVGAIIKGTSFDNASMEAAINSFAEKRGEKLGAIAQPLRVALTGGTISPPIDSVLTLLGRERVEKRLAFARTLA